MRRPMETDGSASLSPKKVAATIEGHTEWSDTFGDECCELKTYHHLHMLLGSGA